MNLYKNIKIYHLEYKLPFRINTGGDNPLFRPSEHDLDRLIVIGISRFIVC
jgi:hypothetical protein